MKNQVRRKYAGALMHVGACVKGGTLNSSSACHSAACHSCMDMLLSSPHPLPQGMMGAYPPYMPMQGPHEGLLSVAPMPPHPVGGPHLPPHHLQQGMPGYPGMLHQGKGRCPSHTCSVTSSPVSPAGGVYLVHGLHSLIHSPNSQKLSGFQQH